MRGSKFEDCLFYWGSGQEQTIEDLHGDEHTVVVQVIHKCGQEFEHKTEHICDNDECTQTYPLLRNTLEMNPEAM